MLAAALSGCAVLTPNPPSAQGEPGFVERHNTLGVRLGTAGRHDQAIAQFQAAIALAPEAAYLHNNLGFSLLASGKYEEAVKALEQAARLDPGHPKAVRNLIIARERLAARAAAAKPVRPAARAPEQPATGIGLRELAPNIYELWLPAARPAILPERREPPRPFKLEVVNGNGARGMAQRLALRLRTDGIRTARMTNQRPFRQQSTEVRYRRGYEDEARRIAALLPGARPVPAAHLEAGMDVRLIIGKDASGPAVALLR
jgi:tetratricopeptide (TPR) repeat protein